MSRKPLTYRVTVPASVSGGKEDRETVREIKQTRDGVEYIEYYQRNLRVEASDTWGGRVQKYRAVEVLSWDQIKPKYVIFGRSM
jgi:hypothetical protein